MRFSKFFGPFIVLLIGVITLLLDPQHLYGSNDRDFDPIKGLLTRLEKTRKTRESNVNEEIGKLKKKVENSKLPIVERASAAQVLVQNKTEKKLTLGCARELAVAIINKSVTRKMNNSIIQPNSWWDKTAKKVSYSDETIFSVVDFALARLRKSKTDKNTAFDLLCLCAKDYHAGWKRQVEYVRKMVERTRDLGEDFYPKCLKGWLPIPTQRIIDVFYLQIFIGTSAYDLSNDYGSRRIKLYKLLLPCLHNQLIQRLEDDVDNLVIPWDEKANNFTCLWQVYLFNQNLRSTFHDHKDDPVRNIGSMLSYLIQYCEPKPQTWLSTSKQTYFDQAPDLFKQILQKEKNLQLLTKWLLSSFSNPNRRQNLTSIIKKVWRTQVGSTYISGVLQTRRHIKGHCEHHR